MVTSHSVSLYGSTRRGKPISIEKEYQKQRKMKRIHIKKEKGKMAQLDLFRRLHRSLYYFLILAWSKPSGGMVFFSEQDLHFQATWGLDRHVQTPLQ